MARKLALLVPADGLVLLGIDDDLLPGLMATGKVEALRLEDHLRSSGGVEGLIGQDDGTSMGSWRPPVQRRSVRYADGGMSPVPAGRNESPRAPDFRSLLDEKLEAAEQSGRSSLVVRAGDLHREVGGYPSTRHRMPVCCSVMRERMQPGDRVVSEPPSGAGASLTIEYMLPR